MILGLAGTISRASYSGMHVNVKKMVGSHKNKFLPFWWMLTVTKKLEKQSFSNSKMWVYNFWMVLRF
jgi:hypothetical protein